MDDAEQEGNDGVVEGSSLPVQHQTGSDGASATSMSRRASYERLKRLPRASRNIQALMELEG
jgi:hypothetical protein